MMPIDPNPSKTKTAPAAGPTAPSGGPEASAPPPGLSAPPGLTAVWYAVTRRWPILLVLGGGLGAVGAAVVGFIMPAKYTATATLHLDPHPPRGVYETTEEFVSFRANQATQVKSDSVLEATLQKPETAKLPEVRVQGKDALLWLKSAAVVNDKVGGPEVLQLSVVGDRADDAAVTANQWRKRPVNSTRPARRPGSRSASDSCGPATATIRSCCGRRRTTSRRGATCWVWRTRG